ncbi:undecaprenyl-phosphate glucose phosphotransferase [Pontibacter ruber]|uniref:Undecaprenyl-phosphate glucose phosphotransferase n=1 Tax=Pontibacter ruber TaxID=1343895 RepID=A0ABW5D294_9BACT|nr:undecaprenyl-phosphate glucose phosphotransferase [Pontibacter ruber]
MPSYYSKYIKLIHVTGDTVAVAVASATAYCFVDGTFQGFLAGSHLDFTFYSILVWLGCAYLLNTYKFFRVISTASVILDALKVILLYILLTEAILNIAGIEAFTRPFLFAHYSILVLLLILWRASVLIALRYYRRLGYNNRRVIVVGYSELAEELEHFFKSHPEYGYKFLGYFDDNVLLAPKAIGSIAQVEQFVLENEVDEIYCCPFDLTKEQVERLIDFVEDHLIRMKFLPEPNSFPFRNLKVDLNDVLPVLTLRSIPLDDVINKAIKRTFDIFFSLTVIILLLSWLLPVLAILIMLGSKGPIFFRQERSGIDYKTFNCFKLRTMYVNSEANSLLARRGDSRITPIGAFLRKTSLDELPQFFNVLMGDMSVVGPRPHMLKVNEEYAMVAEKYMVRHFVKPGITGLSQVRGYRGDTTEAYQIRGRVKLDIFYLENWTFLLDLKIIFYTVYNMLRGDDSAF